MLIEIDTDDLEGSPILVKPTAKGYTSDKEFPSWDITEIGIDFDDNGTEEHNKEQAKKLCDLIDDLCGIEYQTNEFKAQLFEWIREALREKLLEEGND